MSDTEIEVRTRMVPQKYVTLRAPAWVVGRPGQNHYRVERAEDVDIPLGTLLAFYDYCEGHDRYFDPWFLGFRYRAQHAVEAMGWGTVGIRGGLWVTDEFTAWLREKGLI